MKQYTTNYVNTFIQIAEDCPVRQGEVPPQKEDAKTVANRQFDALKNNPYAFTSDDILFEIYAQINDLAEGERQEAKQQFFSKGQACFRSSPLAKRYGWGIHCNTDGKIAIYGLGSPAYQQLSQDRSLKQLKAMRSKKA